MESPLNQRLRWSPPDVVYTPIDVTSTKAFRNSSLTDNSLTALPADIFDGLTALKGLDLSCNDLTALNLTRFDPFATSLTFLDITGNSFTTQPTEGDVRAKLTAVQNLYISGTNTECLAPTDTGLSALSLSVGDLFPRFVAPGTTIYTAIVAHDASSMTVNVTARDPNAVIKPLDSRYSYDNDPDTDGLQIDLLSTRSNVGWTVQARNGFDSLSYQILVYRDHPPATIARLGGLTLSGFTLTETFDSRIYAYTATAPPDAMTTTVTPELIDDDATFVVRLGGVTYPGGTVPLAMDDNVITVDVTAEDGTTMQTYTVTVTVLQDVINPARGTLKKCVNSQAVYPLSEQHGLEAQERR